MNKNSTAYQNELQYKIKIFTATVQRKIMNSPLSFSIWQLMRKKRSDEAQQKAINKMLDAKKKREGIVKIVDGKGTAMFDLAVSEKDDLNNE
jgi:hypothetical protein